MEEKIVKVLNEMSAYLTIAQMKKLQEIMLDTFAENKIEKSNVANNDFLQMFLDAKKIEGCSGRTIQYYQTTILHMFSKMNVPIRKITTEEIRAYLSEYQENSHCTNVTVDNIRRNISSFFSWLEEEDYILKSPMKRIHKIKTKTVVKSVISDEGIEKLRDYCTESRDLAIIDLLYSTGIRVGELVNLNIDDIDLEGRECVVYGKGNKERRVYFDAKAKVREELAPLIEPENDEVTALRFDALMFGIELAYLIGKKHSRGHRDLKSKVSALSGVANIPEIMEQAELINKILHTDYLANAGINEFEDIRENLRDLIKYIPKGPKIIYDTNFADEILAMEWKESELENDDLKNYKAKAEYYVRQHQDNEAIAKLKSNQPLTSEDIKNLENIMWSEIGTKQDYEAEYGEKPLGEFVREIVGLDMTAAKEAFAEYLDETNLDSRQIYFVNQIVEFIVHNGMMKDLSVLQEPPFTDQGSIVEVFTDLSVWMGIRKAIEQVNANALAA